ncbi:hypothetical protein [Arcobacter sp.]|uniref:hypothetical protein n=1 Tax=unclassified Arcobacter TaxID=2593671 RepID=UPI003B006351
MGLITTKEKVKGMTSLELIDVEGDINSKGNYIHVSGSLKTNLIKSKFKFIITIAGFSLCGNEDPIEERLDKLLSELGKYEISHNEDLEVSSKVVKIDRLLAYEVSLSVLGDTE